MVGVAAKNALMIDLAHTFHHSWRSLLDLQALILPGRVGNKPGFLKPLDNLNIVDLSMSCKQEGWKQSVC